MSSKTITQGILQAVATLIGVSLLLFFLWEIQSVIVYIVIAAILSLVARPLVLFFKKRLKLPNTLSVIISMVIFLGFLLGLIGLFIPLITQQGENLSLLNFNKLMANANTVSAHLNDYFLFNKIDLIKELNNFDFLGNIKEVPTLLNSIIGALGSLSIGLFSVLFIAFFLMKDSRLLHDSLLVIIPAKNEKRVENSLNKIKNLLSRYFIGLILQITILFIIYSITLTVFGVENGIVIAFLCSLLNLIPYIGPIIGGLLMLFLTMTSNLGQDFKTVVLPTTYFVLSGYVLAQLIDNFLSQPLIFSKSVRSHPLEIFLIIIICGLLFGVVGMVIAVPLYTSLKVILKEFLSDNKIVQYLTKGL